jgi:hypothetical protein
MINFIIIIFIIIQIALFFIFFMFPFFFTRAHFIIGLWTIKFARKYIRMELNWKREGITENAQLHFVLHCCFHTAAH